MNAGLAALLCGCLLLGCRSVDQAAEVAIWRAVLDADAPAHVEPLRPDEPLSLGRALELANHDQESLGLRGEDYLQAVVDERRQAAVLLPTFTLAPTFFARDPADLAGPLGQNHHFDLAVAGGYANLQPYSQIASVYRAASTSAQRRALLLDAKASVLLDVARAFYQVLRAERSAEVLASSLRVQEERVLDVEAQNQVGIARPLDVAQAKAQAAATRVTLSQARSDVRNARAALAFLIGLHNDVEVTGPLIDDFELPANVADTDALLQRGLAERQDLAAAHAQVDAAWHAVDVAVGQYWPSISLNLQWFLYRESIPADSIWSALLQANVPLFVLDRIDADVRTAWSQFRQARLAEAQLERAIAEDVRIARESFATSEAKVVELEVQVRAAQDAFDQAADLVRVGRATSLERLVAQDQLLSAQLGLTSQRFESKIAWLVLQRACGTLNLRTAVR